MSGASRPSNLLTLAEILRPAQRHGFGVAAFSARYTPMVSPILQAAQNLASPAIVQISQNELEQYRVTPGQVAGEFYRQLRHLGITVPIVLHLDHTRDLPVIEAAIAVGFTSVMIDASALPYETNIELTREVVTLAHAQSVSVEAELGRIGTTDFVEIDRDDEMYTDPRGAQDFVVRTGVDALAVSVGTAHGIYEERQPQIDYERLKAIRDLTLVPLVLHGGSGVPAEMMIRAIQLPGGGVSKINIATDLELAMLGAIGQAERMTNAEYLALPPEALAAGQAAVRETVENKIRRFVISAGQASKVVS